MLGEKQAVSVGSRLFLHPESAVRSEGNVTGVYKPVDVSVDVGYAKLSPKFSIGTTLYYIQSQIGEATGNALVVMWDCCTNKNG